MENTNSGAGVAIAHTREDGAVHELRAHLEGVAALASTFARRFDTGSVAYLAGLWHDLGKYSAAFQAKLQGALDSQLNDDDIAAQDAASQRVDHSTAGALLAMKKFNTLEGAAIAYAIAGHHAGLADYSALRERFVKKRALLGEAIAGGVPDDLPAHSSPLVPAWIQSQPGGDEGQRRVEFWTRMVFSTLCDADFLDTEAFMAPARGQLRPRGATIAELARTLREHLDAVEAKAPASRVNTVRASVRRHCVESAALPPGRFTLTVPTGGGKTLAAMAFALEHAARHGLERVVVAVPYTAILEQNAAVYREVFARFGDDAVIEHHSALDPARETFRNKLATENWDAPIVVTTTVQLFESLFARRPGACRKLHRLARSVIVLDEAQTLPPGLLPTILDGITELTDRYGATVVSCTATQPALARTKLLPCGLTGLREIMPDANSLFEALRRVEVRMPPRRAAPVSWPGLADALAGHDDVLAIVHLRNDARALSDALDARLGDTSTVHLSALQCPAHRSEIVASIKARKRAGERVRVVATQLVEAGVDLDFAVVYRALAGFEALAQAAGRCNREGRLAGLGVVNVFVAPTQPPQGVLRDGLAVARSLLDAFPDDDVLTPASQRRYFEHFYHRVQVERDRLGVQVERAKLNFEETARRFKMIDEEWAAPVVVPWGDGAALLDEARAQANTAAGLDRRLLRRLQRYTVSVSRKAHDALVASGRLARIDDTITALPSHFEGAYSARYGLSLEALGEGVADVAALVV